jgi:predicted phage terminase large subunit-like protein
MQRLHEEDLSGHILAKESEEGWVHLRLPQEYESVTHCKTSLPFEDPRTEEGELLFPERFPPEVLVTEKRVLGSYGYAGQHQQRPSPAEGGIYKRAWFNRRWVRKGASTEIPGMEVQIIPDRFDQMAMIADCAFKDTDTSDRVAIGVWGKKGPNLFLLDLRWDQMGLTTTIATFNDLAQKWPMVRRKMIEDKANGTAVIEVLKKKLPGVMPIDSKETSGGKDARIHAASPDFEAGNVWIPTDAPWVADYIEECVTYPAGAHDDALDMSSYAVNYLSESSALARMAALGRLGEGKLKRR